MYLKLISMDFKFNNIYMIIIPRRIFKKFSGHLHIMLISVAATSICIVNRQYIIEMKCS